MRTVVLVTILFCAVAANAQSPTADLHGVVVDASGTPLAGATVTVANTDSGSTRELTTSASGNFVAASLPPGQYQVTAVLAGYPSRRREALDLHVGTATSLRLEMRTSLEQDT